MQQSSPDSTTLPDRQAPRPHTLRLRGDLSELRSMSTWLRRGCRELGVAEERAGELEVCANEIVTNVISYGYAGAPASAVPRAIELHLACAGTAGRLTVEDNGCPFDPVTAVLPEPPAGLADAPIGGLGIKMVRSMMARCTYRRVDGRNVFVMTTHP